MRIKLYQSVDKMLGTICALVHIKSFIKSQKQWNGDNYTTTKYQRNEILKCKKTKQYKALS